MARQEKIIQICLESLHMALSGQYIFAIAFFSEDLVTKSWQHKNNGIIFKKQYFCSTDIAAILLFRCT